MARSMRPPVARCRTRRAELRRGDRDDKSRPADRDCIARRGTRSARVRRRCLARRRPSNPQCLCPQGLEPPFVRGGLEPTAAGYFPGSGKSRGQTSGLMPVRPRYPRGVTQVRTARLPVDSRGGESHRRRHMRIANVLRIPGSGFGEVLLFGGDSAMPAVSPVRSPCTIWTAEHMRK
jgi:hypothetical protein